MQHAFFVIYQAMITFATLKRGLEYGDEKIIYSGANSGAS